ncbi:hypothetical protein [Runella sp.]|uniref:hypothetical protein n=1 Tax=Runella sp. TaxID=1960881 RepID=UPI00301A5292
MNISDDMYLRLINHLTNDETDDEHTEIETLLAQNQELQKEFEELRLLQEALQRNKILQQVNKAHNEIVRETKVIPLRKMQYTWLAAASVLLLCGVWGVYNYQQNRQMDALYQTYSISSGISINAVTDSLYNSGISYLQQNQLQKAIEALSESKNPEAQWYLVMAHLKDHDKKNAIITLKTITKTPHHLFSDKAGQLLKELEK